MPPVTWRRNLKYYGELWKVSSEGSPRIQNRAARIINNTPSVQLEATILNKTNGWDKLGKKRKRNTASNDA